MVLKKSSTGKENKKTGKKQCVKKIIYIKVVYLKKREAVLALRKTFPGGLGWCSRLSI